MIGQAVQYKYLWHGDWLTSEVKSFEELIQKLQQAEKRLKEMVEAGVTFTCDRGSYITFVTDDPAVAKKFGFNS